MRAPDHVVYSWESDLRQPGRFLIDAFLDLKKAVNIGWRIFRRDLSTQYRETLLGVIWLWVPALTVSGTFILAENANLISAGSTHISYPAYVILSSVLWQLFSESAMAPMRAVDVAKPLLSKVHFPAEAILFARLLDVALSFLVKLPLVIGVLVWFQIPVSGWLMAFPLGLLALFALGLFLGLLVVPIGGMYQDVTKTLPLALTFWMFLTPVVFAPQVEGALGVIVRFNPVTPLLVTTREFLTGEPITGLSVFLILASISLVGVFVSWLLFRLAIPIIVERAGN